MSSSQTILSLCWYMLTNRLQYDSTFNSLLSFACFWPLFLGEFPHCGPFPNFFVFDIEPLAFFISLIFFFFWRGSVFFYDCLPSHSLNIWVHYISDIGLFYWLRIFSADSTCAQGLAMSFVLMTVSGRKKFFLLPLQVLLASLRIKLTRDGLTGENEV